MRQASQADWTPDRVSKYWDWLSRRQLAQNDYFAEQVGAGVARLLRDAGALKGKVLDFGCGPGFLCRQLARRGVSCQGIDFSPASVEAANARLAGEPTWGGARLATTLPLDFPPGTFDLVMLTEVAEHLNDALLTSTLDEARRLIRKDGLVFVTTPNTEDLKAAAHYCPFCDTEFHQYQHVRSFDPASLGQRLTAAGFEVISCCGIDLYEFQAPRKGLLDFSPRTALRWLLFLANRARQASPGRPLVDGGSAPWLRTGGPNLCALARVAR